MVLISHSEIQIFLSMFNSAYSNNDTKINMALKPAEYLTNIYEMGFMMRNFVICTHQC